MEEHISQIEQQCRKEIQAYVACVEDNPETWPTLCEIEKKALNHCTSQNPMIKAVNEHCKHQFTAYNNCIYNNSDQLEVCLDVLETFNRCAAKTAKEFTAKFKK